MNLGGFVTTTNRQRVTKALDLLRDGLAPYAEREVRAKSDRLPIDRIRKYDEDPRLTAKPISEWDVSGLLRLMTDTWSEVFRDTLGHTD